MTRNPLLSYTWINPIERMTDPADSEPVPTPTSGAAESKRKTSVRMGVSSLKPVSTRVSGASEHKQRSAVKMGVQVIKPAVPTRTSSASEQITTGDAKANVEVKARGDTKRGLKRFNPVPFIARAGSAVRREIGKLVTRRTQS